MSHGPCRCHVCQGIHCLVWHPGHSHKVDLLNTFQNDLDRMDDVYKELIFQTTTTTPGAEPNTPSESDSKKKDSETS